MKESVMLLLNVVVTVFGGLGVFLLGMKNLSDGLQSVGGGGLRKFMGMATSNKLAAIGTGVTSTLIVQSSSVITVMLVGFVGSGMMTLAQAVNVLIGANIGTTGTIWIVAFAPSPEMLGLAGLAIGGCLYFFLRSDRLHDLGFAVIGLGLVFLGLYFMSKGVLPIRQHEGVQAMFTRMQATTIGEAALVALVAAVFTAVIQSSAATIAIAMTLATQQLITYEMAVAVLFGANIGTTATGWLASIGGPSVAKRTALAHTLSNLLGSVALIWFFPLFVKFGQALFPGWNAETMTDKGPVLLGVMAPIAVTDTVFALIRGILLYPFVAPFARLIERIIPPKEDERPHLSALKSGVKISPVIACDQALVEVTFMRDTDIVMLTRAKLVLADESTDADEAFIVRREARLDEVQHDVTDFLGNLLVKRLPMAVAARARRLLRIADELESISDEVAAVLKARKRLRKEKQHFSQVSKERILDLHSRVMAFAAKVSSLVVSPRVAFDLEALQAESKDIHEYVRRCRQFQLMRVGTADPGSPNRVLVELDVINAYERIRAYYLNIAEALAI
ncbi:MAG: Na/Pi cotransporter family protein [Kiritimatiellae bacterium]|nr:Na/Pi cotransporter family protein [Kiritimatiellia bacterium]